MHRFATRYFGHTEGGYYFYWSLILPGVVVAITCRSDLPSMTAGIAAALIGVVMFLLPPLPRGGWPLARFAGLAAAMVSTATLIVAVWQGTHPYLGPTMGLIAVPLFLGYLLTSSRVLALAIEKKREFGAKNSMLSAIVVICVGALAGGGIAWGWWIFLEKSKERFASLPTQSPSPPATAEQLAQAVRQLQESLRPDPDREQLSLPGLSLHLVAVIHRLPDKRRQYIFSQAGQPAGQLELYLDPDGRLCLRVSDPDGNSHGLTPPQPGAFRYIDQPVYLVAEYGRAADRMFLRLTVNGVTLAKQWVPGYRWPELKGKAVIGSDLSETQGASLDMFELFAYGNTLDEKSTSGLLAYVRGKHLSARVSFNGSASMHADIK